MPLKTLRANASSRTASGVATTRVGSPSARDRILASCVGTGAIQALVQGQRNVMVGIRNNEVVYVPFIDAVGKRKDIDKNLIRVLDELSI